MAYENLDGGLLGALRRHLDPKSTNAPGEKRVLEELRVAKHLHNIRDKEWKIGDVITSKDGKRIALAATTPYIKIYQPDLENGRPFKRYKPQKRVDALIVEGVYVYDGSDYNDDSGYGIRFMSHISYYPPETINAHLRILQEEEYWHRFLSRKHLPHISHEALLKFLEEDTERRARTGTFPIDLKLKYEQFVKEYEKTHGHPISYDYID